MSKLSVCLEAAHKFQLSTGQAQEIIEQQKDAINENWGRVCDEAQLTTLERNQIMGRQFMNPFISE